MYYGRKLMDQSRSAEPSQQPQGSKPERKRSKSFLVAWVLAGLVVIAVIQHTVGADDNAPTRPKTDAEIAWDKVQHQDLTSVFVAHEAIRAILKDPGSAQFSMNDYGKTKGGIHAACGHVNAKNSFGAMTGSTSYLVITETNTVLIRSPENGHKFATLWNKWCTGKEDSDPTSSVEFMGIKFGTRPDHNLKPYDSSRNVWVFAKGTPATYLASPVKEAWFLVDGGKIFGAGVSSSDPESYAKWLADLIARYGQPTSSDNDKQTADWDLWSHAMTINLKHFPDKNITTLELHEAG